MKQMIFNGVNYDVYTMQDWEKDGSLKLQIGWLIEPEVYWQLRDCVPPKANGNIFQVGEAESWDWDMNCNLYTTFERVDGDYFKYIGLKP